MTGLSPIPPASRGPVPRGWERDARCRAPRADGLDFAELTSEVLALAGLFPDTPVPYQWEGPGGTVERADALADLATCRRECAACPVLARCWHGALTGDPLPGVVAGLTEEERAEARDRAGTVVEARTLAVMVPRPIVTVERHVLDDGTVHLEEVQGIRWVLDLSTETAPSGQWDEITAEELAAVRVLREWGWSRDAIAERLVTVRAAPIKKSGCAARDQRRALADQRPGARIPWTPTRVAHALAVLAGSQGSDQRREGVA